MAAAGAVAVATFGLAGAQPASAATVIYCTQGNGFLQNVGKVYPILALNLCDKAGVYTDVIVQVHDLAYDDDDGPGYGTFSCATFTATTVASGNTNGQALVCTRW